MKALSVKPHWADLIRSGVKTIETRTRRTNHRGPLLICSSKPDGMARCIVEIIACRPMRAEDWAGACCEPYDGAFAWVIGSVTLIDPIPVKGQLGIFEIDLPPQAQIPPPRQFSLFQRTQSSP